MSYVITDGKSRHEFDTLSDAIEYRKDVPLPIFRSDNLGNLHHVPMSELAGAVQQHDNLEPLPEVPADTKARVQGRHTNLIFVVVLGFMLLILALVIIWAIFKEAL